ncbi:LysR family transcriptional regulator [Hyphomicrobiales bacterium 4NK60-0047b]|jgi:DNA-binding transcriptional LysR family regulator
MDKLTALKIFCRVVELGSFHGAASDLGFSNAAISKNIKELEAELQARLINRTTRTLTLTDIGTLYYERVSTILDQLNETDEMLTDLNNNPRGVIKINAPMSLGLICLSPIIEDFMRVYPEITIDLWMDDRQLDFFEYGFDIAIRGTQGLKDSSLISRKLAILDRVVCASPGYLQSARTITKPEDLVDHNCLIYNLSSSPERWLFKKKTQQKSVQIKGRFRANNSLVLKEAACSDFGVVILPRRFIEDALDSGALVPVLPEWFVEDHSIFALYPAHRENSRKIRVFLDFLIEAFKAMH